MTRIEKHDHVNQNINQNINQNFIEPKIIEQDYKGSNYTTEDKLAHTYMLAGFLGPDMASKDIYIADVALNILGAGNSSRLNRVLKEEKDKEAKGS